MPITGPTHTLEQAKRKWKEVTILVRQPQYFDHSFRVGLAVVVPELSQIRQSLSFPPHNRYQTPHVSLLRVFLTKPTTYNAQYPTNQETYQLPDQNPEYPTSYQEPMYPTHQTYQLPDQHHEYPTSTTNTTDQPSCQPQMS